MSTFVYNETMSWVIDWINTQFTTANDIFKIEEVYLWGVAYRDVSFVGNVVTFADAPPVGASSPTIDYFIEETAAPTIVSDVTFGDCIQDVYDKIGVTRLSNVILENYIKRELNKWIKRIKNTRVFKDRIQEYTFNKSKDGTVGTYNASFISIGENDYVPSNGAILLWDSTHVRYETYSSWNLWAIAWYVYKEWDKYSIWYKIPSWVKRVSEVMINGDVLRYVDVREFSINRSCINYTILQDSLWDRYIFLPYRKGNNDVVSVKYAPDFPLYVEDADVVDIEYEYIDVIVLYAAYMALLFREDDRWQAVKQEYKELLKEYKVYKWRAVDWINNKIRAGSLKGI